MLFLDKPSERIYDSVNPSKSLFYAASKTRYKSKSPASPFKFTTSPKNGTRVDVGQMEEKRQNDPDLNYVSCKVRNKKGQESVVKLTPLTLERGRSSSGGGKKEGTPSLPDSGIQSPLVSVGDMIKERWKVVRKIGGGGFGDIYEATDCNPPHNRVAIKVEPVGVENSVTNTTCCKQVLKMEVFVLKRLQGKPNFCKLFGCGRNDRFSYVVMSLRGPNLAYLRRLRPRASFTPATVANAGLQMLNAIKDIHSAGFLHRDVKPSNFAVDVAGFTGASRSSTIYALDFGLARQYLDSSGNVRPPRSAAGFRGTVRYASINAHANRDLSRRDDVWSLFYVLVEFVVGYLPWRKVRDKDQVGPIKESFDFSALLKRSGHYELCSFHAHLNTLTSFYDVPDYTYLQSLLVEWRDRVEATADNPYDWEVGDVKNNSIGREQNAPSTPCTGKGNNTNFESTNTRSPLLQGGGPLVSYQQSLLPSSTDGPGVQPKAPNFSSTFVAIKPKKGGGHSFDLHKGARRDSFSKSSYVAYGSQVVSDYVTKPQPYDATASLPQNYEFLFPNIPRVKANSMPPDLNATPRLIQFDKDVEKSSIVRSLSPRRYPKLLAYNYVINNAWTSAKIKRNLNYPISAPPFIFDSKETHFKFIKDMSTKFRFPKAVSGSGKLNVVLTGFDSGKGDSSAHSASSFERGGLGGNWAYKNNLLNHAASGGSLSNRRMGKQNRLLQTCSRQSSTDHIEEDLATGANVAKHLNYNDRSYLMDDTKALAEPGVYTCHGITLAPPFPSSPTSADRDCIDYDEEEVGIDRDWNLVTIDPYKPKRCSSLYKAKRNNKTSSLPSSSTAPSQALAKGQEQPKNLYTAFDFGIENQNTQSDKKSIPAISNTQVSPSHNVHRTKSGGTLVAQKALLFSKPPVLPATYKRGDDGPGTIKNSALQRSKSFVSGKTFAKSLV